jgi:hypothetical protein
LLGYPVGFVGELLGGRWFSVEEEKKEVTAVGRPRAEFTRKKASRNTEEAIVLREFTLPQELKGGQ